MTTNLMKKLQWGCFGSNRTNKQKVNPKVCGGIPSWYDGPYLFIYQTSPADYKHITSKCNKFFVLPLSHLHFKKVYQLYNTNQWIQQRCHREDHNQLKAIIWWEENSIRWGICLWVFSYWFNTNNLRIFHSIRSWSFVWQYYHFSIIEIRMCYITLINHWLN